MGRFVSHNCGEEEEEEASRLLFPSSSQIFMRCNQAWSKSSVCSNYYVTEALIIVMEPLIMMLMGPFRARLLVLVPVEGGNRQQSTMQSLLLLAQANILESRFHMSDGYLHFQECGFLHFLQFLCIFKVVSLALQGGWQLLLLISPHSLTDRKPFLVDVVCFSACSTQTPKAW